jgi:phosphoribosylamine---glycine ligase
MYKKQERIVAMDHNTHSSTGEKIMVIGGTGFGGREHVTTTTFLRSPNVAKVYVVPGNDALFYPRKVDDRIERIPIKLDKKNNVAMLELARIAKDLGVLAFVGPEYPLSQGIVDLFEEEGIPIVGPNQQGAQLEGSKAEAKDIMASLGIPVPHYAHFTDPKEARKYIQRCNYQVVVKADGLAEGKGSIVTGTPDEADDAVYYLMEKTPLPFDGAGKRVVIEERLYGEEFSFFLITDGTTILPMGWGLDYKRVRDHNQGLNTGGMGAYSPYGEREAELTQLVMEQIAEPLIRGCRKRYGIVYKGIMYIGGTFVRKKGTIRPYVFEINVRGGDPEAQVIYPRLKTDLAAISRAVVEGRLADIGPLEWNPNYYVGVCLTSGRIWDEKRRRWLNGYPEGYKSGRVIYGLDTLSPETLVFHNGTRWDEERRAFLTTGGRVLTICCKGETLEEARTNTYREVEKVTFEKCHYRRDIGRRYPGSL